MRPIVIRKVEVLELKCPYCGVIWQTRGDKIPRICAGCKRYWKPPKDEKQGETAEPTAAEKEEKSDELLSR